MSGRKTIANSEYHVPDKAQRIGRVQHDAVITVSLYLNDRQPTDTRTNHEHLDAQRSADHAEDIHLIRKFAGEHGLQVVAVEPQRRLVKLSGPASALEAAFATELHCYSHPDGEFRAHSGSLSVPEELADRVLAVLGLGNQRIVRPRHSMTVPTVGYLPNDIAAFYGFPPATTGAGQAIALLEFGGGYTLADMQVAAQAMNIALPEITTIEVNGITNTPGSSDDVEVTLDIQIAMGAAPQAQLLVYFSSGDEMGMVDAVSAAVHDQTHRPSVISISWGSPESQWSSQGLAAMNQVFVDAGRLGVTVICASGDHLAGGGLNNGSVNVDFPASSPNALACGGTRMTISGGLLAEEVVWNSNGLGSGGGISVAFTQPSYQASVSPPVSLANGQSGRAVPDIAANADPATGYRIYLDGRWGPVGGTSAATPLWAGLVARANQSRAAQTPPKASLGFFNTALYGTPGVMAPVTQGNNYIPGTQLGYRAGPGYNCCTGLGTPAASGVFPFLVEI